MKLVVVFYIAGLVNKNVLPIGLFRRRGVFVILVARKCCVYFEVCTIVVSLQQLFC